MQQCVVTEASRSGLSEEPRKEDECAAKEIHLTDDKVSELPESPNCTSLIALYLQGNNELTAIPPLFFQQMALLQLLDLSGTSIKSLPKSLPKLVALKKLFLRGCQLFMELTPQVGELRNLEDLDLDETQIMDLPREIGKLLKLSRLKVSFYHPCGRKKSKSNKLIDPETISILSQLTELSIDVNPADKRWDDSVAAVVKEVSKSKTLRTLSLYLPEFQLLGNTNISLLYSSLSRFRFTVGRQKRRIISRVPHKVEAEFRNGDKCLRFVNGEIIPVEIKRVLRYSTSFYLDHHATARDLSEFGIENMKSLKFCLLAECNKMESLFDGEKHGSAEYVLESLEYLSIYYMDDLGSIWRGPNRYGCMSKLKFLALHTCPQLTYIFSQALLESFVSLEEIIIEDCPQVTSLVSDASLRPVRSDKIFLPSLKRLMLLYLPELVSISNGLFIAPKLGTIGIYYCPKLKSISKRELSSENLKIIKGECQWWEDLNWNETEWGNRPDYLMHIFSPIDYEKDVMTLLAESTDLFEATLQNEGQQLGQNEKLLKFSTQDQKGQWSEETKTGTDVTKLTSSESILPSIPLLRNSDASQQTWSFSSEDEWLEDSEISQVNTDYKDEPKAKRWSDNCNENENKGVIGSASKTAGRDRVAFRTRSDREIIDDGYRWRKYGKKIGNGTLDSRSYYRCSTVGCPVKKRLERDSQDRSFVITTYEGIHNHYSPFDMYRSSQISQYHRADNVEDATDIANTYRLTKGIPEASARAESQRSDVENLLHQFPKHAEGRQPGGMAEWRFLFHKEVEACFKVIQNANLTGRYSPLRVQSADGRKLQLNFTTKMPPLLFTESKVVDVQGAAIQVVLLDVNSGTVVQTGPESATKLNVVLLDGDFNEEADEYWTKEHFEKYEINENGRKQPFLTGELQVTLKEGVGTLGYITFTGNSSWIRSRKFRLGLKIAPGYCEGIRVREAKTEAFIVKDYHHRGVGFYKKHDPLALHDKVWRLEKIGKDGSFHKNLFDAGILTVKDFLRLFVRHPMELRNILGIGPNNSRTWEIIVKHAKTCVLGGELYVYYTDQTNRTGVVFNPIDELTGLIAEGQFLPLESLNNDQRVFADSLAKIANENWHQVIKYEDKFLPSQPNIEEFAVESLDQQSINRLDNKPSDLCLIPQPSSLSISSTITQLSPTICPTPSGRLKADVGEDAPKAKKWKPAKTELFTCGIGDFRDMVQRMTGVTTDTLGSTRV